MTTLRMPDRKPFIGSERTGWRDEKISQRHRLYGRWARITDIDFMVVEYSSNAVPKALIEYKHFRSSFATHFQLNAYRNLGDMAGIPFFLATYCNEEWWYRVSPQNNHAREWFTSEQDMTEHQYVTFLRDLRGVTESVPEGMNHIAPPRRKAGKAS